MKSHLLLALSRETRKLEVSVKKIFLPWSSSFACRLVVLISSSNHDSSMMLIPGEGYSLRHRPAPLGRQRWWRLVGFGATLGTLYIGGVLSSPCTSLVWRHHFNKFAYVPISRPFFHVYVLLVIIRKMQPVPTGILHHYSHICIFCGI